MKTGDRFICTKNYWHTTKNRYLFKQNKSYKIVGFKIANPILMSEIGLYELNELEYYEYFKPIDMKEKEYDYINPNHYQNNSKEVWEMMVDIWGKEAFIKHCEMTSFKYRMRAGLKPDQPIERDMEKCLWYENKAKELRNEEI
jgi:hypothetical protein